MSEIDINEFLVEIFNRLLRQEERALSGYEGKLSVKEFHVIETAQRAAESGGNTMGEIAARYGVTLGSMTTAVKTLEAKGYLVRSSSDKDRRKVRISLTPRAVEANAFHTRFHNQMTRALTGTLSKQQLEVMTQALYRITRFFETEAGRKEKDG